MMVLGQLKIIEFVFSQQFFIRHLNDIN